MKGCLWRGLESHVLATQLGIKRNRSFKDAGRKKYCVESCDGKSEVVMSILSSRLALV